jgi:phage baseplate assembly protein W
MPVIQRTFRDLDLNFTKNPSTKDVAVRLNEQSVIRSVRNLIYLSHYEKPFHPEIGSSIRNLLFENITPLTAQHIKKAIEDVINNFEPRVNLNKVIVQSQEDYNRFDVYIEFYIVNNSAPTSVNLFLERVK